MLLRRGASCCKGMQSGDAEAVMPDKAMVFLLRLTTQLCRD